jgi:hypothetical protein
MINTHTHHLLGTKGKMFLECKNMNVLLRMDERIKETESQGFKVSKDLQIS